MSNPRFNPVVDELHDQMMVISMRAATYAQQVAELREGLARAEETNRGLSDALAGARAEIERLKAVPMKDDAS